MSSTNQPPPDTPRPASTASYATVTGSPPIRHRGNTYRDATALARFFVEGYTSPAPIVPVNRTLRSTQGTTIRYYEGPFSTLTAGNLSAEMLSSSPAPAWPQTPLQTLADISLGSGPMIVDPFTDLETYTFNTFANDQSSPYPDPETDDQHSMHSVVKRGKKRTKATLIAAVKEVVSDSGVETQTEDKKTCKWSPEDALFLKLIIKAIDDGLIIEGVIKTPIWTYICNKINARPGHTGPPKTES
jgi:hypothetical protein